LSDRRFWSLHDYPEIAELRAKRFADFDPHQQAAVMARIRKGPPRDQWRRNADAESVKNARVYRAVQELRRIELAGAPLSKGDKEWLNARISVFPDLAKMARLDDGFTLAPKAHFVPPNPDSQYDLLAGEDRLKALEIALSSAPGGWDDSPAEHASDWISEPGNPVCVLADLESVPDGGAAFARVWERIGWAHSPEAERSDGTVHRDLRAEGDRVLSLLAKLPGATIHQAINGISQWLSAWQKWVVAQPEGLNVWLKLWPIAVEVKHKATR
jgi:hypothetical protein